jgi:hypothetical protein
MKAEDQPPIVISGCANVSGTVVADFSHSACDPQILIWAARGPFHFFLL